jgi:hypothetical protein
MADDTSYQAHQDVIAGARAIRSNPAALAQLVALLNPPPSAPPRADPAGALATSRSNVPNMSDAMAGSAMMPGGGPLRSPRESVQSPIRPPIPRMPLKGLLPTIRSVAGGCHPPFRASVTRRASVKPRHSVGNARFRCGCWRSHAERSLTKGGARSGPPLTPAIQGSGRC